MFYILFIEVVLEDYYLKFMIDFNSIKNILPIVINKEIESTKMCSLFIKIQHIIKNSKELNIFNLLIFEYFLKEK